MPGPRVSGWEGERHLDPPGPSNTRTRGAVGPERSALLLAPTQQPRGRARRARRASVETVALVSGAGARRAESVTVQCRPLGPYVCTCPKHGFGRAVPPSHVSRGQPKARVWACPQQDYSLVRRGTVNDYTVSAHRGGHWGIQRRRRCHAGQQHSPGTIVNAAPWPPRTPGRLAGRRLCRRVRAALMHLCFICCGVVCCCCLVARPRGPQPARTPRTVRGAACSSVVRRCR